MLAEGADDAVAVTEDGELKELDACSRSMVATSSATPLASARSLRFEHVRKILLITVALGAVGATTAVGASQPAGPRILGPRATAPGPATFTFRARGMKRVRFRCSLDAPRLHACGSTYRVDLTEGTHVLRAQAVAKGERPSAVTSIRIVVKAPLPSAGNVVAHIALPDANGLIFAAGGVWVPLHHSGAVARIDPATGMVSTFPASSDPGQQPGALAYGDGALWLVNYTGPSVPGSLVRIDPTTGSVSAIVPSPAELCCDPIVGGGSVWLIAPELSGGSLVKVSEQTNAVVGVLPIANVSSGVYGAGSLWLGSAGAVVRVDPTTNSTATIPVKGMSSVVGFAAGTVWIDATDEVLRLDPSTGTVVGRIALPEFRTDDGLHLVASDGNRAWITGVSRNRPALWRVDVTTNAVTGFALLDDSAVGDRVGRVAVGAGAVWVTLGDGVLRVAPS